MRFGSVTGQARPSANPVNLAPSDFDQDQLTCVPIGRYSIVSSIYALSPAEYP